MAQLSFHATRVYQARMMMMMMMMIKGPLSTCNVEFYVLLFTA
jgi:hypothetical protein